jgi:hypothetical protein
LVRTVVTREPEWDDAEREKLLGLALYEAEICECGIHSSLAHDPERWFTLEDQRCPLCADLAIQARIQGEKDRKVAERFKDQPDAKRGSDGRRSFVREMTPDEVEQMKGGAS